MVKRGADNPGVKFHVINLVVGISQEQATHKDIFLNGPNPASFSFILGLFQTNNTIFTTNKYEKCHVHPVSGAGIGTHDLWNVSLLP